MFLIVKSNVCQFVDKTKSKFANTGRRRRSVTRFCEISQLIAKSTGLGIEKNFTNGSS